MIRLLVRLLFWPLLLALLLVSLAPLTGTGTRLVVEAADRWLPLDIRYAGGKLAGELQLQSLLWSGDGIRVELQGVVLELAPGCLWHSKICFRQLQVERLLIDTATNPQPPPEQLAAPTPPTPVDAESKLFVFPVELESRNVQIDSTRVTWVDGHWSQGMLQGRVRIVGSTITVGEASINDAWLELRDAGGDQPPAADPIDLPEINIPLNLVVARLHLDQPGWEAYGDRRQLQSMVLQGQWLRTVLQLGQLDIHSAQYGQAALAGQIDFSANWPLTVNAEAELAFEEGWPERLEPRASVELRGDLAALRLHLLLGVDTAVQLEGQLNTLDRDLPFTATALAQWSGDLLLQQLIPMPEALAELALSPPLRLSAGGSLAAQAFQLEARGSAPALPPLELQLAGQHSGNLLTIDDMRLQDQTGTNTLWGSGSVNHGERLQWSANLESSGLDLPGSSAAEAGVLTFNGRLEGSLHVAGSSEGDAWELSISDTDLSGTINALPARVQGFAGLSSDMRLAASDLQAELNGATLALQSSPEVADSARLAVDIPELGRWVNEASGQLKLNAQVAADWQQLRLTGSLKAVHAGGAQIDSGTINGVIRRGQGRPSILGLTLTQVAMPGLELSSLRLELNAGPRKQGLLLQTRGDLESELQFDGSFDDTGHWRGTLAPTTVSTGQGEWRIDEAVGLLGSQTPLQLKVAAHCWQHRSSSLCFSDWDVGEQGGGSVDLLGGMDLLAALLPEDIELGGVLNASLALGWAPGTQLQLNGELHARDWLMTRYYGVGETSSVHWDQIDGLVHQSAEGLQLTADGYREGSRKIDLNILLPASRQAPLKGSLAFSELQLGVLVPFAPSLAALEGELTGNLALTGNVDEPLLDGTFKLAAGRFAMVGNSTELNQVELRFDVRGDRADIAGSGMLGGGKLDISGQAVARPEPGVTLSLVGSKHELLVPPTVQMQVSEDLQLSLMPELLDIRGKIRIHEGIFEQDALPEGSVDISPDVVEVDYSGNVVNQARVMNTSMDIGLVIEDKFRVVGEMIDTMVGGDLQLLQSAGQPLQLFGNLNVIGGELRAYHQLLRVKRGTISFAGNPANPELDVRAQREISGEKVVVGVAVQGTLQEPRLDVFSDPVMPQGETMSYLVRGRGLDSGANSDGLAMALSVGTGVINQTQLVTELNRIPGVSNIAFGAEGSADETAATVGGYIGDRLYLSYGVGLYEPVNVLTARLYLQTRLWLEVVSRLENSVDLYYSFDLE